MMNDSALKLKYIYIVIALTLTTSIILFKQDAFKYIDGNTSVFNDFGAFYEGMLGTIVASFGLYYIYRTYHIPEKQFDILKRTQISIL